MSIWQDNKKTQFGPGQRHPVLDCRNLFATIKGCKYPVLFSAGLGRRKAQKNKEMHRFLKILIDVSQTVQN